MKDILTGIQTGDRASLARGITLIESRNKEHRTQARNLIKSILPFTGKAKRIAISGTPGVGKSTFLEAFGMHLIRQGARIAVLAVDPTSQVTGGSILGDKTRMTELSAHKNAFIRPSPNGDTLGGIAAKTREAMLLCDGFGFDYIFIETVGVGQSELSVSHLVDFFILLMQPGSGDELQGIKRGILEVSDLVLIHKADGANKKQAQVAQHDFKKSLSILRQEKNWHPPVIQCSSLAKTGFEEVQSAIEEFFKNYDIKSRQQQLEVWMRQLLMERYKEELDQLDLTNSMQLISSGKSDIMEQISLLYKGQSND